MVPELVSVVQERTRGSGRGIKLVVRYETTVLIAAINERLQPAQSYH